MKMKFLLPLACLPMILTGCPKEESAAEKVEDAAEDAKDAVKDAVDK